LVNYTLKDFRSKYVQINFWEKKFEHGIFEQLLFVYNSWWQGRLI